MKKKILTTFAILALSGMFLNSEDKTVKWNVSDNIADFIYKQKNVEKIYYGDKPVGYGLSKNIYGVKSDVELYLSFDENKTKDETGRYSVSYSQFFISDKKSINRNSGYFVNSSHRVELSGSEKTYFQPGINLSSFSISFWMFPVTGSYNESLLKIGGQYYNKKKENIEEQSIVCEIVDGKISWNFNNLFYFGEDYVEKIELISSVRAVPERWTHASMTFDAFTGIIRLYIDGIESGIVVATVDGTLNGSVYNMKYHSKNRCLIKIANSFTGGLDEFYIFRGVNDNISDKYNINGGEILSNVILLDRRGVYIKNIAFDQLTNNKSDLVYFYRYSDKPFHPESDYGEKIAWKKFGDEKLESNLLKYIQWKIKFLPGADNEYSPNFRGLSISYKENIPPSKPLGVMVLPKDGMARIKWLKNSENDVKGYKIYYGTKSFNYFGKGSELGDSPIVVSKDADFDKEGIEIKGLKNNIIYYFSVTAFDDDEKRNESDFSEEVACRPIENWVRNDY
ncbi:MAG TPA: hypothetical protein PLG34_01545 [Spirochaetota bacterium]|nr:MAG: hypothetical protein BWX91_00486 [Spirochaetes bacterium ADurb.Bin133]HNZ26764.1 hypothetical protein [Spirochaetota bacterium]HPY86652.1 hypothetical protein [Spirochaetota bacterium]